MMLANSTFLLFSLTMRSSRPLMEDICVSPITASEIIRASTTANAVPMENIMYLENIGLRLSGD